MSTREETARQTPMSMEAARSRHDTMVGEADVIVAAVLRLHEPSEQSWGVCCGGCDYAGYEAEPPVWPCRTVRAVRDALWRQP